MSSYRRIYYHIIFGTKYRRPVIPDEYCDQLYSYIAGIAKNKKGKFCQINGANDHLHIFSDLHPEVSLASFIKDIKVASSKWMKSIGNFPMFREWQGGYGAFTHSEKEKDWIIRYVTNQKEHHKKESFLDEYKRLLAESHVDFDEKFLL